MSYILDALKKVEHEHRSEEQSLDLHFSHPTETSERYPQFWIIVIVTINVLLILAFMVSFFNQPVTPPLVQTPQPIIVEKIVEKVVTIPQTPILLPPSGLIQVVQPKSINEVKLAPDNKIVKPEKKVVPPTIPEEKKTLPNKIPLLYELSTRFQASVPDLEINAHIYSKQRSKRFVLINGHRYTENTFIQPNLQLQAIRPDDIVLEYEKQLFRIQRAN